MIDVISVACTADSLLSATVAFHSLHTEDTEFGKKLKRSVLIPEVAPLTLPELLQSSV